MRVPAALLSACALILAGGCSDGDDKPGRSVTVRPGATVNMKADEYSFDPGRITMKAGGRTARLRITLANKGTLAHNVHIGEGDRDMASTRSFPAGESRSVTAKLPPGTYRYLCTVADHEDLGMVGELEIK